MNTTFILQIQPSEQYGHSQSRPTTRNKVKRRCANDKQQWYDLKASEAERTACRGDQKTLYKTVKELTGQRPQRQQIKLSDGRFARTHDELMNRWKKHFKAVLNCPVLTTTLATDDADANMELPINVNAFSENEVRTTIKQLKNGKAPGVDNIKLELLKYANAAVPHLTNMCNMVWHQEEIPADSKNGIIIPLPKKGDLTECSNWCGITLLFARVLLNRMQDAVDQLLQQQQSGFRRGRSPDLHLETNTGKCDRGSMPFSREFHRPPYSIKYLTAITDQHCGKSSSCMGYQ